MKSARRWVVFLAACAAMACTSGPPPPDTRPYAQQILAWRQAKDDMFRSTDPNSGSPLPMDQRGSFAGLAYFPIDQAYHVPAYLTVESSTPPLIIELQTSSKDEMDKYQKVGTLGFSVAGASYTLTAFAQEAEALTRLFVPFGDLTNGRETYGGGRFIELDRTATGIYDLDFNRAYHPFCVFNSNFICPVPPRENRLPAAIRAGERLNGTH